jgi:CMP-N-acetylneuraminic acid synthetase
MKNIVLVTAKGGNKSIPNKNTVPILGVPVVLYPIRAARYSRCTDGVFVSTEDTAIAGLATDEGAIVLERPSALSRPESEHKDVIKHAVQELLSRDAEITNVIVLLGNTVHVTAGLIDRCFTMLDEENCDSVITVWKAQDDHPYRALSVNDDGYVRSFNSFAVSSNRQSYPDVFFYDQGVWAFKADCALAQNGPTPWVWLGQQCKVIERAWVTGRDIHSWIDISASSWYLTAIQCNDFVW